MEKFWESLKNLKKSIKLIGMILPKKKTENCCLTQVFNAKVYTDSNTEEAKLHSFFDQILYDYAMSFVGKPYYWGGDDPMGGFDCSGVNIELMKSVGLVKNRFDTTAQGLLNYFEKGRSQYMAGPQFGTLLFFGRSTTKITHTAFAIDQYRMIEAGGGGSHIKSLEDAIKYNAFIRVRPIYIRKDLQAKLMPFYQPIGAL